MAYSRDIYQEAYNRLQDIKKAMTVESVTRKEAFFHGCPRAAEIEKLLSRTAIVAAKSILSGADTRTQLMGLRENNSALLRELHDLLKSAGLPENYLDERYSCGICRDDGFVDGKMCDCFRKILKNISYERLNKLSPLSLSTFESFSVDCYPDEPTDNKVIPRVKMEKIFRYCRDYAYSFTCKSPNLFMHGATGLGKTHLSLSIASVVINSGFSVVYLSAPSIISRLEKERFSHYNQSGDDTERHLMDCDLLILDDLGTEFQTNFSNSTVYNIINSRILYQRPTIISTNLSTRQVQSSYSERLVSRIMGNFERLYFLGRDIRSQIASQNFSR